MRESNVRPAMPLITCIGELLVDFLPFEEGGRTVGFRMHPGGSLLNVSVAAARLGGRVALCSKVSTDFFGVYLRGYVESQGVEDRWLAEAAAPSTLAFVSMDTGDPVFSFYGDGAADTLLRAEDLPEALLRETAILHVGSISLLRGSTPAAVLAACEQLSDRALISLDPNVRPRMVTDEDVYRRLLRRVIALTDVIKVSAADLAWLAPGQGIEDAAVGLLEAGAALVVVTRGGGGVIAVRGTARSPEVMRGDAFRVDVVDAVGAGDSFDAGLLTWLAEGGVTTRAALADVSAGDLRAGLRFAAAVAALNCTRAGADPPTRAAVGAFLDVANGEGDRDGGH